jgi:tripeptidyl-peptidase-1
LTSAEADALVVPHPDSREAVRSWIGDHGINAEDVTRRFAGGEWIILRVTVAQAERMLNAKYNVYYNPASSERVVRTMGYSLPRVLLSRVDVVIPTTYFSTIDSMRATHFVQTAASDVQESNQGESISTTTPAPSCNSTITPSCLRTLYNTMNYTVASSSTNKLGVAGYLQQYANRVDLQVGFSVLVIILIFL